MILKRLIAKEVLVPFFAWTGFLCVLLYVMAFLKGTEVLLGSAVTFSDFARFSFFLLPGFLVQALPIAFLLGLLLGLGRLVEDGELRAWQALGASPTMVLGPPVAIAVALCAVLIFLTASAQPWGQSNVRQTANGIIRRNLMNDMKPGRFHEEVLDLTFYAGQVDDAGRWRQVLVHDERDRDRPLLVLASRGRVKDSSVADGVDFELEDGVVHRSSRSSDEYAVVSFDQATLRADVGEVYHQKNQFQTKREEQSPGQLLAAAAAASADGRSPRPFLVTFHWRLGQMLMPLAFAFLGCPLAVGRRRGGRGAGVMLTLVGYVGFYLLARLAVQLADAGLLAPALAGQLPNLVFVGLGLALLARVAKRGAA